MCGGGEGECGGRGWGDGGLQQGCVDIYIPMMPWTLVAEGEACCDPVLPTWAWFSPMQPIYFLKSEPGHMLGKKSEFGFVFAERGEGMGVRGVGARGGRGRWVKADE